MTPTSKTRRTLNTLGVWPPPDPEHEAAMHRIKERDRKMRRIAIRTAYLVIGAVGGIVAWVHVPESALWLRWFASAFGLYMFFWGFPGLITLLRREDEKAADLVEEAKEELR